MKNSSRYLGGAKDPGIGWNYHEFIFAEFTDVPLKVISNCFFDVNSDDFNGMSALDTTFFLSNEIGCWTGAVLKKHLVVKTELNMAQYLTYIPTFDRSLESK